MRDRRHRPDQAQEAPRRRLTPRPACVRPRERALDDAELTWTDIDAVVIGKAPDAVRGRDDAGAVAGRRARRERQADAAGAHRRQRRRLDRRSSRRTSSRPAVHERVLTVAYEKQSEGNAQWGLARRPERRHGRGRHLRPVDARLTSSASGAPEHIGWKVAVKDRRNAAKNPYAHLQMPNLTIEEVKESPMLWDPHPLPRVVPVLGRRVRDGAHQRGGRRSARRSRRRGSSASAMRSELGDVPRPRPRAPAGGRRVRARDVRRRPASPTRASRSTWPSCTCRSAGTSRCGSRATTSSRPRRRGR